MKLIIKHLDLSVKKYKIDKVFPDEDKIVAIRDLRDIIIEYELSRNKDNNWYLAEGTYSFDFHFDGKPTLIVDWSIVK